MLVTCDLGGVRSVAGSGEGCLSCVVHLDVWEPSLVGSGLGSSYRVQHEMQFGRSLWAGIC